MNRAVCKSPNGAKSVTIKRRMSLASGLILPFVAALALAAPQAHASGTAGAAPPHSRAGKVHHGSGSGTKAKAHTSTSGHKKAPAAG
jgi:hypothetical protein